MVSEKEHEKYLIEYLTITNQPPEYDAWKYHLDDCNKMNDNISGVITTEQLHSTMSELRFCAGSNPARGISEICDCEDLLQRSRLEL